MNYAPQFITLLEKLESLMTKKANILEEEPIPRLKTLLYYMENQFINLMKSRACLMLVLPY